jgi:hypothetical protein
MPANCRERLYKGWIQTWLVHMREPRRLRRELGTTGFAAFQLLMGGNVLAALVHPVFVALLAAPLLDSRIAGQPMAAPDTLSVLALIAGYVASGLLGAIGLARRGLAASTWWLVLMPLHWALLSLAAWRALIQLVRDPYRWEKTEHGRARTSRLAPPPGDERTVRYIGAGRSPRPAVAAWR